MKKDRRNKEERVENEKRKKIGEIEKKEWRRRRGENRRNKEERVEKEKEKRTKIGEIEKKEWRRRRGQR